MSRYRFEWLEREGERIGRLRDGETGSEADIAATFGMNVVRFRSAGQELVLQPPSFGVLRQTPFRYGIPLLSPPGRTSFGRFVHRGTEYRLPANAGEHNMHGELGTVPWRAADFGADAAGAYLAAEYRYRDDPARYAYFPHDLTFRLVFRLREGRLSLEGEAANEGDRHAPFALGFHPYFRFACGRGDLTVRIPARAEWPLDAQGRPSGPPVATRRTEALRAGLALAELERPLTFWQCEGAYRCDIVDRAAGHRIGYEADGGFGVLALFLPPWGEAVSLEPHTCIPDAWNLPWDASVTGAGELAPGERRTFGWRIDYRQENTRSGEEKKDEGRSHRSVYREDSAGESGSDKR